MFQCPKCQHIDAVARFCFRDGEQMLPVKRCENIVEADGKEVVCNALLFQSHIYCTGCGKKVQHGKET